MKTVVYQSYRTTDVPAWLTRCMETVRAWAAGSGYAYEFIDDSLFDRVPAWYREKVRGEVRLMSDLARVKVAREFLQQGYDRTIWVDADVVIFSPEAFILDVKEQYAFCREIWMSEERMLRAKTVAKQILGKSRRRRLHSVNNAVTVFVQGNSMIDFYLHAAELIVRRKAGPIDATDVSTEFLSQLYRHLRFPLILNVGLFSPVVMADIVAGGGIFLREYMVRFAHPLAAANLCASGTGKTVRGHVMDEAFFSTVVEKLLETKGEVVNRYLEG